MNINHLIMKIMILLKILIEKENNKLIIKDQKDWKLYNNKLNKNKLKRKILIIGKKFHK
jgi:hypothetical protein